MTQDERWNLRYQEVLDFITANHRNPSRHRIEEHDMLNWVKANRKVMNKGEMKEERVEKLTIVDLCRDSAMSESELSPLLSLLPRLSVFAFL